MTFGGVAKLFSHAVPTKGFGAKVGTLSCSKERKSLRRIECKFWKAILRRAKIISIPLHIVRYEHRRATGKQPRVLNYWRWARARFKP